MATKTITISIREYNHLQNIARRFEQANAVFSGEDILVFHEPSTKNAQEILREMKKTKKYSPDFLKSLKQGMKESTFFSL